MSDVSLADLQVQNALDFMMYSYFGVTFSDSEKDILYAAARKAYQDATMRSALVMKKSFQKGEEEAQATYLKLYKKYENEREAIRYLVRETAIEIILNSEFGTDLDKFNIWHKNVCQKLLDKVDNRYYELLENYCSDLYKEETKENGRQQYFTYGNAQKLVNMYVKNLYVITITASLYRNNDKASKWFEAHNWIIKNAKIFHIPIDSYILDSTQCKINSSWSKIGSFDEYCEAEKSICSNGIENLDQEGEIWIRSAKYNSMKDHLATLKKYKKWLQNKKAADCEEYDNYIQKAEDKKIELQPKTK